MTNTRIVMGCLAFGLAALSVWARDALTADDLKMLQDPGGWEYIALSDPHNGIQTKHTCFDGRPHPEECSGTLILTHGNTFVQNVHIHGQSVQRHGTYRLEDKKLTFVDEFGTEDGPYNMGLNTQTKHLVLETSQAQVELELESQYHEDMRAPKPHPQ